VLEESSHVLLVPPGLQRRYPAAIVVLEDPGRAAELEPRPDRNLILRLARADLERLASTVETLLPRCGRLNLRLLEVERYGDRELLRYRDQLDRIRAALEARFRVGQLVEVGFLTDRLRLDRMRNCSPGLEHLTVATDGSLHLCPGFRQAGAPAVGELENGIRIRNPQLLDLRHAPICSACDAYQCQRCLYLNWRTTGELNTPSEQQCILAHHERNASARLGAMLRRLPAFGGLRPLEETDCLDPFTRVAPAPSRLPIQVRDGERLVRLPPLMRVSPSRLLGGDQSKSRTRA
jgi:CXXX repeat peptide maturase